MFTTGHLYLIFLAFGALGLLSSMIFGDIDADADLDMDAGGDTDSGDADGPRILSLRVIFAFLLAFGIGAGAVFLSKGTVGLQLAVGFGSGLLTAVGTFYLMKFLYSLQGNSNVNSDSFIGKTGVVTIETTSTGLCQVKLNSQGGDQLIMAREINGKKLKQHNTVEITSRVGSSFLVTKKLITKTNKT